MSQRTPSVEQAATDAARYLVEYLENNAIDELQALYDASANHTELYDTVLEWGHEIATSFGIYSFGIVFHSDGSARVRGSYEGVEFDVPLDGHLARLIVRVLRLDAEPTDEELEAGGLRDLAAALNRYLSGLLNYVYHNSNTYAARIAELNEGLTLMGHMYGVNGFILQGGQVGDRNQRFALNEMVWDMFLNVRLHNTAPYVQSIEPIPNEPEDEEQSEQEQDSSDEDGDGDGDDDDDDDLGDYGPMRESTFWRECFDGNCTHCGGNEQFSEPEDEEPADDSEDEDDEDYQP